MWGKHRVSSSSAPWHFSTSILSFFFRHWTQRYHSPSVEGPVGVKACLGPRLRCSSNFQLCINQGCSHLSLNSSASREICSAPWNKLFGCSQEHGRLSSKPCSGGFEATCWRPLGSNLICGIREWLWKWGRALREACWKCLRVHTTKQCIDLEGERIWVVSFGLINRSQPSHALE